jgi:integrase
LGHVFGVVFDVGPLICGFVRRRAGMSVWWGEYFRPASPCTLRHRFVSRAYRGTPNLRAVQVLLGHQSIATTERYCAVDDSEIRAAMMAAGE